jgi:sporulation protein YlmC with PRC-barrel domain
MRTRYLVTGLFAAALLSSTAFAQTSSTNPPPAAKAEQAAPKLSSPHWRSSKMIGLNVYNEQNEKLGDINEIILNKEGKVLGYVIGVGGFLGMGEHDILVEPSKIKFVNEPRRTTTSSANPPAGTATNTTANNPPANPNAAPTNTRPVSNTTARDPKEAWYPDHAMLSATKDQLKAMPQFKYSSYN